MRATLAIAERELKAYFLSPVGYVVIAGFLLLASYMFYLPLAIMGDLSLRRWTYNIVIIFIILVPALTMRLIAEERKTGTIEVLATSPVTDAQVILGKFLGCWLACGIALVAFYVFFGVVAMSKEHQWPLANYLQAMTLHWIMLGVVVAMTLLGSLIFTAISSNTTICFIAVTFILLLGRHLDRVAMQVREP